MAKAVIHIHRKGGETRWKGLSGEELRSVGLSVKEALALKIPLDARRKTRREEKIKALRRYLNQLSEKLKRNS